MASKNIGLPPSCLNKFLPSPLFPSNSFKNPPPPPPQKKKSSHRPPSPTCGIHNDAVLAGSWRTYKRTHTTHSEIVAWSTVRRIRWKMHRKTQPSLWHRCLSQSQFSSELYCVKLTALSLNFSGLFCILGQWGLIYGQMHEAQFAWYAEWLKGGFSYILPIATPQRT